MIAIKGEYLEKIAVKTKVKPIKCPLCKGLLIYGVKDVHYWVCEDCPFVGFELYDTKDVLRLKKALNR